MPKLETITEFLAHNRGMLFPLAAAALVFVILMPLPTFLLDFLLMTNILLTLIILMTVMYIKGPLELNSFPAILLAMTLLRLVLNTATTRIILTNGPEGTGAAGQVIETFGMFVAGNSLAVGIIIFVIITVIQFVVITKGATRIAEVAARFTLDGMPGKQMAIDADLNAGTIDEKEARRRRDEITAEADFYGAMDGASKFVRGDAVAGLVITFVNLLGGLYIGMVEGGMPFFECASVYLKLSIGDGLASQIPAFIISIAAGMLVTRSNSKANMGEEVIGQLLGRPVSLAMAGGLLAVLMLTPLPTIPLLTLSSGCGAIAVMLHRGNRKTARVAAEKQRQQDEAKPPPIESHLGVDALEMQIGYGLVKLVDKKRGGDLLDRISSIRKQVAVDLGVIVPPVRIRDSGHIGGNAYALLLRGQEIARGELFPDRVLAIDSGLASETLAGIETREPAFNLTAWWIDPGNRDRAERLNYTVVEPTGVVATHLTEIIKQYAAELLSRGETQRLVDNLKERNAPLVEEVIPNLLRLADVQRVLQNLLRERVPVRDLEAILETLGDWAVRTKDVEVLTEYVRNALARTICAQYKDDANAVHCVSVDPATEDFVQGNIQRLENGSALTMPPDQQALLATRTQAAIEQASAGLSSGTIVVLCSPPVRMWIRRIIETSLPQTPVLALNEIVRGVEVRAHGVISIDG
jgi:flagellar biosynthesis protein FlhA